jgi:hypothetical protein
MSRLPALRPKELAGVVRKLGFVLDRQRAAMPFIFVSLIIAGGHSNARP